MSVVTQRGPALPPKTLDGGGNGSDGGGRGGADDRPVPSSQLGLWLFLVAVTMMFSGFVSAYIVMRRGEKWQDIPTPNVLWLNTAVLLLSSAALEKARRASRRAEQVLSQRWLWLTGLLGGAFLIGQLETWRQLRHAGVYLPTNPHSSFFYILTGIHGLHLLGGLVVLAWVIFQVQAGLSARRLYRRVGLCAVYWHFLGGLWLYLFWLFLGT